MDEFKKQVREFLELNGPKMSSISFKLASPCTMIDIINEMGGQADLDALTYKMDGNGTSASRQYSCSS